MILLILQLMTVNKPPDIISYGTAIINPLTEVIKDHSKCGLIRLGLKEGIGNTITLIIKNRINSPRPCIGCDPDGMPSGHTFNSFIGFTDLKFGFVFGIGTGVLRHTANRHTWKQITTGASIGILDEVILNRAMKCYGTH